MKERVEKVNRLIGSSESIADYTQRPLYTVNCGELGERACFIEESLKRILFLATRWNAVVLLDEADVFLAERKTTDLERNGLVSGKHHNAGWY